MNNPLPLRKLIIVGGGTAGWMAASAISQYLRRQPINILLVESDGIGTVGVGEASVPVMKLFNDMLGIDEREFVQQTSGSFKLGIEFRDWLQPGSRYFHGFGDFGAPIEGIAPHHFWLRAKALGDDASLAEYSFPAQAAYKNRFVPPSSKPALSAAAYKYAYHFDAGLYAKFLRVYAEARGVVRKEGEVLQVKLSDSDGRIESLVMANGEIIDGDFFIDCSGFRGLLIEKALAAGYEDWSHWLPCDRALVAPCKLAGEFTPYTISSACTGGWRWRIPLQHRVGNGYVYASQFSTETEIEKTFLQNLEAEPLVAPRTLRFVTGRRREFWKKNCVALGLASGFMEPLESTSIQLIQTALARFLEHFPSQTINQTCIDEYNRITANEYARIRDFLILHYCTSLRNEGELWRYCRTMPLPDELEHKITLFKSTGRVPLLSEESYMEPSWVSIFIGQEIFPSNYAEQTRFVENATLLSGMKKRRDMIAQLVAGMPTHSEFVARTCPNVW